MGRGWVVLSLQMHNARQVPSCAAQQSVFQRRCARHSRPSEPVGWTGCKDCRQRATMIVGHRVPAVARPAPPANQVAGTVRSAFWCRSPGRGRGHGRTGGRCRSTCTDHDVSRCERSTCSAEAAGASSTIRGFASEVAPRNGFRRALPQRRGAILNRVVVRRTAHTSSSRHPFHSPRSLHCAGAGASFMSATVHLPRVAGDWKPL